MTEPHAMTQAEECRFSANAMTVFCAWERLRLAYNMILIAVVVTYAVISGKAAHPTFWWYTAAAAVEANLCFCAGPVAEGYLCWFGVNRRVARWSVFIGGTMIAVGLAIEEMQRWHLGGGFLS